MAASRNKEMEIAIKIAGKVESSFKNAIGSAIKGIGGITKEVSAATAAAASAVAAASVAAVNVGKGFEASMSQVAATMLIDKSTEEGKKAFETLENAARACGASTAFSATEAAEALNYLALAGYDADKAAAALPTVLKLAGAGAMELAAASDMVTDSMSALGIEATEANLTRFSDELAKTASKANTSVAQLGEAILTVGGTAKGLSGGTVELNTALGILADNGLKGAEGGTHLRNIILSLQNPTDKAAASLKQLGVDVYDSEGKMRGLNEIFADLQGAMDGMNNAQKDSILSELFNKTDLTAANAMLSNCTDRFNELSEAVENSAGACENMYAIQLDNLNGDIDILKSGLEDLGISIYKDLNGPLREMTQLASDMVGELSEAYKSGGMEGMVGTVGNCLSEVVNVMVDYAPKLVNMGVDLIGSFVQGIDDNKGSLAVAVAQVLTVFTNGLFSLVPQVLLVGSDIVLQLANSITDQLPVLIDSGVMAVTNFTDGIIQRLPIIISTSLTLIQTLVNGLGQNAPMLISAAIQLIGSLISGIVSMLPQLVQMGIHIILNLAQGIISNLPLLLQIGTRVVVDLVNGITQSLPMIIQGGFELLTSLVQGIIQNLPDIVQAAVTIVMSLIGGLIMAIPQLCAAAMRLPGKIIDAIFSTNWLEVGWNLICAIGKGIIDGALSIGSSIMNTIKGWFGGGDASDAGKEAAESYVTGVENGVTAASTAFGNVDTSGAMVAGIQTGEAFSTGLTDSMATESFDMTAFNANIADMGATGADAFNTGLNSAMTSAMAATNGILDTAGLSADMATAGADGAAAFTAGFNTGLDGVSINAGGLLIDTSQLNTAVGTAGTDINTALNVGWDEANANAQTAMEKLTTTVTDAARSAAKVIREAFENMTITIPKPKFPDISVSTNSIPYGKGGNVSVPDFSVKWNAVGGIFKSPTIFNTPAGMQGAGEAGPEAILPLDTLWAKMKEILNGAISANGGTSIVDALLERLGRIGDGGGGNTPELAGAGGLNVQYSPVYNLYGSATKQDAVEAERMSQAEFNKMMRQYERDRERRKL